MNSTCDSQMAPEPRLTEEELCYASATRLIELFKKGDVTPRQVLEAQIRRIEARNGLVNAITFKHYDEARNRADKAGERYRNGTARPLEGITVAIKDENFVKGWIVTAGSVIGERRKTEEPATTNSAIIDFLLEAGAVLHIQTTVPEAWIAAVTWSKRWGVTRTPWNLAYTCGGSSGGSGAALAAGFTTLATGSDIGGSIRIPAAFNGVCGFKPPFGRVPSGQVPFSSGGPMARTMDDLALMQDVLTGPHRTEPAALRPKLNFYPPRYEPLAGLKLAVCFPDKDNLIDVDLSVKTAMAQAIEVFRNKLNCTIEEIKLETLTRLANEIFARGLTTSSGMGFFSNMLYPYRELLCRYTRMFYDRFPPDTTGPLDAFAVDLLTAKVHEEVQDKIFLKGYTALLMPTLATPYADAEYEAEEAKDHVWINGERSYGYLWLLTWPFNLLNRYPVVNVPIGREEKKGIPLGMQVIGNSFDDLTAFRVASAYYNAAPRLFEQGRLPTFETNP